jgi:large subunit ribosomal protein L46
LAKEAGWGGHAWLNASEVEERLRAQGDEEVWKAVRGMFGVGAELAEDAA